MDEQAYMTAEEVAAILRVHHRTVRRWCEAGLFPGSFQLPGGGWRIPPESIETFKRRGSE